MKTMMKATLKRQMKPAVGFITRSSESTKTRPRNVLTMRRRLVLYYPLRRSDLDLQQKAETAGEVRSPRESAPKDPNARRPLSSPRTCILLVGLCNCARTLRFWIARPACVCIALWTVQPAKLRRERDWKKFSVT